MFQEGIAACNGSILATDIRFTHDWLFTLDIKIYPDNKGVESWDALLKKFHNKASVKLPMCSFEIEIRNIIAILKFRELL